MLQTTTRAARAVGRAALLVAALASTVQAKTPATDERPADSPAIDMGRQALDAAAAERKAAYAQEGEAREAALLAAAAAFARVADDAAVAAALRAEGAFRAGELLRARGRGDEARTRFGQAAALGLVVDEGSGRSFGARAQLELAHALRREGESEAALEAYAHVSRLFPEEDHVVVQARGWRARLLVKAGRAAEAQGEAAGLEDLLRRDPREALKLVDSVASTLAEAGEEDRARELVSRLDGALAPLLAGDGKEAARLAEARDGMRVTLLLTGT